MSLRILYLSCHSILEHDEISLFNKLGHYVFSPGAYVEPANPGNASLRPALLSLKYDAEDVLAWKHLQETVGHDTDPKGMLSKEFVDRFDVVIVMHIPEWISKNWEAIKHKTVIWRTIGQSISHQEKKMGYYRSQGLKIVRYSPMENNIPGFCGSDALIRFYKNPEEFSGWTGESKKVINFTQSMKQRDQACNFTFFEEVTQPFSRALYGPGNEIVGDWASGQQSFDTLKQLMRESRVYFYTGTHPASYTLNFMEAWMTGIPVVAIGFEHGNAKYFADHNLYEVDKLIENGVTGFVSDDKTELRQYIKELLYDDNLAANISKNGRQKAIEIFGEDTISPQWEQFLNDL